MNERHVATALLPCAAALAALLAASTACAEGLGGLALDQHQPSPAGDPFFGVPSPFIGGHLVFRALAEFDYAQRPLAIAVGSKTSSIVGSQGFVHVNASFALWDRLLVSALMPIAVLQTGDSPKARGLSFPSPSKPQAGDFRFGLRLRAFGDEYDPFQIGVSADFMFPTAPKDSYAGEGAVRIAPQLMIGGRIPYIVYGAKFGAMITGSDNPSSLTYGAGAAVTLWDDRFQIGPEVSASTLLRKGDITFTQNGRTTTIPRDVGTNAELLLGAKLRVWKGLTLGAAGGPGLTSAAGTPTFRVVGLIGWAPPGDRPDESPGDADQDGIPDIADACPNAWGPKNSDSQRNGCPVLDRDEDGIEDADDACPDQKGDKNADKTKNGCAADRDGDGVPDAIDACPDQKGVKDGDGCPAAADSDGDGIPDSADACPHVKGVTSGDAKQNGCPPNMDSDGDGIPDSADACPKEKGPASSDSKVNGCPKLVRVNGGDISIVEAIAFKVGKKDPPAIEAKSEAALVELKDVILGHAEWTKIEVQGHTDNKGNARYNEKLSASRAESVRDWLVAHGVAAARLTVKGWGGAQPIADNKTADGREKNKRIVLVVLEKK